MKTLNVTLLAQAVYFLLNYINVLNDEELAAFMDHFELFTMAYSWGGFESLILCNQPEEIAKIARVLNVN